MAESRDHIHGFDWLRTAGIIGVVWIHGCDTSSLARQLSRLAGFAVPVFILISFFLLQRHVMRRSDRRGAELLISRCRRLIPAYLVWSAAYLVVRMLKHQVLGGTSFTLGEAGRMILTGGASYQLYFVAGLIYWTLIMLPLIRLAGNAKNPRRPAFGFTVLGVVCFAVDAFLRPRLQFDADGFIFQQMLGLSGYVPLGLAAALFFRPASRPVSGAVVWIGWAAGVVGLCWMGWNPGWGNPWIPALALFGWSLVSVHCPVPWLIRRISVLSYGIFLVHAFFIEGLQLAVVKAGLPLETFPSTLAVIGLSFLCSMALCEALDRIPKLRWLIR